jgi:hypothetical protein
MIKLISHDQFFAKIKKAVRSLGMNDFVLEKRNNEFIMGFAGDLIAITDEKDLVRVLFGPVPEIPFVQTETQRKFAQFLPLPMWIWGWDSV